MQVIETDLKFRSLVKRKATKRIVLHHSASGLRTTYLDIHRWHLNNGWAGIGYHYVIYPNGAVYRGRPEWAAGAHAYQDAKHEANSDGIGVCLIGNFETGEPAEAQLASLVDLIQDIRVRYPGVPVIGHNDVMATACPGKNFPLARLLVALQNKGKEVGAVAAFKDIAKHWAKNDIEWLAERGILAKADNFRPNDTITRAESAALIKRAIDYTVKEARE